MSYVIIGNSIAGIASIEAIREYDNKSKITIISDEPYLNYSRPLISYLLGKKIDKERVIYREKDFYKNNKVQLILNKKAVKLDLKEGQERKVILSDRGEFTFDKLLIATGGVPIVPRIKGLELNGIFTFTKLRDVERIEEFIKVNKVKNSLVLGGGLIGLKATEALMELGISVTIVELADRILSSTFDRNASRMVKKALKEEGCSLITNDTVATIEAEDKKIKSAVLKSGRRVRTDLIILAIGVKPNIQLVKDTPIKINRGILVDKFMQTNVPNIYAAGDCCEALDSLLNINRPIAIWPNAYRQGKIAGYNMAGVKEEYEGSFPMNSVELCGIPTISVGITDPGKKGEKGYEIIDYLNEEKLIYKKLVIKDNRIVGTIFVGDINRAGIYTGLIKDKVNISEFKERLLEENFGLLSLPKEYRKHLITSEAIAI